ncbi:hypothetical protein BDZ45DRAFT_782586 [Acephala macrosclerotiorum]|nr:hypothetical protein BDZ45DRAFT_782586 [Acephala macrosclerotiorum]
MEEQRYSGTPSAGRFTLCPRLPIELRTMIWKQTLEPRVIEIKKFVVDCSGASQSYEEERGFYNREAVPSVLQVCQESRRAIIAMYPLSFGSMWYTSNIRFNFELDTLYFGFEFFEHFPLFFSILDFSIIQKLRYIAIDARPFLRNYRQWLSDSRTYGWEFLVPLQRSFAKLTGLRELLAVYDVDYWFRSEAHAWVRQWKQEEGPSSIRLFTKLPPAMHQLARELWTLGIEIWKFPGIPKTLLEFKGPPIQVALAWRRNLRLKVANLKTLAKQAVDRE